MNPSRLKYINFKVILFCIVFVKTYTSLDTQCLKCGLVIDTDVGVDDAMGISMIIQRQKAKGLFSWGPLIGVTTVNGNTGAPNATRNTQYLLNFLNFKVPVFEGGTNALATTIEPTYFYGYDGFGDFLPPLSKDKLNVTSVRAPSYLAAIVAERPGKITLLFLGALTNLALALHINTQLIEQARHIFILGGNYQGIGDLPNYPGVEANIYGDPDAAEYVFSKITNYKKVTLVPNEAVLTVPYSLSFRNEKLGKVKGPLMKLLNKAERIGIINGGNSWLAYDQSICAYLLDPTVATHSTPARLSVTTCGARGTITADLNSTKPNVNLITKFNREILTNLLLKYTES